MKYIKNKIPIFIIILYLILAIFFQYKYPLMYTAYINPIFWLFFAFFIILYNHNTYARFAKKTYFRQKMIILTCAYLLIVFYLGFFIGFSKSGYSHTIIEILKNCYQIILPIICIEIARSYILNSNKKNKVIIIAITIIIILLEVDLPKVLHNFQDREVFFKYVCSTLIPLIAYNGVFSYLTLLGSYELPLIYQLSEKIIYIFVPVIPNMNWFVIGTTKIIAIVTIYIRFKYYYNKNDKSNYLTSKKDNTSNKIAYFLTISVAILIVSFMLGLFKYEPVAILSNSMLPTYERGDVVIYEKLSENQLKNLEKGSIIVYKIGVQVVAHRINDVVTEGENRYYETKGDNNESPDINLVQIDQILGVYKCSIQYVGYPSVFLHVFFNNENATVEIK